jgi:branched-chain amino acid transport system permease protein
MTAPRRWRAAALVGSIVVVSVLMPFVLNRFLLNVLTLSMVFALVAMSVNLLGFGGLASLGQGGVMAAGAYGLAWVSANTGAGPVVQASVGVVAAVAAGALFGVLTARTQGVYFILATLALGMVVWGLSIRLTSITGGENGISGIERPAIAESHRSLYYVSVATVAVATLLVRLVSRSPFGLVLRGIQFQESRLRTLGCPVWRFKVLAFALSGVFAGMSGVLYAYYNRFVNPSVGTFNTSGKAVLMVIVGGMGTLAGPIIGAVIVTAIENVLNSHTARWPTALGLLYVLTALFAKDGISGRLAAARRRVARRMSPRSDRPPQASAVTSVARSGAALASHRAMSSSDDTT